MTDGQIPADTFGIRLAIVRAEMHWNYDQAERATGINSESWRTWEKGMRRCTDIEKVASAIARVTPYSRTWIMVGGPLAKPAHPDSAATMDASTAAAAYERAGMKAPELTRSAA